MFSLCAGPSDPISFIVFEAIYTKTVAADPPIWGYPKGSLLLSTALQQPVPAEVVPRCIPSIRGTAAPVLVQIASNT